MFKCVRDTFFIVSMDPGSNTGVAVFELDAVTLDIVSISTMVIVLNNLIGKVDSVSIARINALHNICTDIANVYKPKVVGYETAFLNSRFPKAVVQLSQYTSVMEQAFNNADSFTKLYGYPPKLVKKLIGGGGNADKDGMLVAVNKIPELSSKLLLNRLTEHEIDAIAVGYITVQAVRTIPHILISY